MQLARHRVGLYVAAALAMAGQAMGATPASAAADTSAGADANAENTAGAGPEATTSGATDSKQAKQSATVTLEEVVVATNRYEATDLQLKAPNAISVLSAEDLANTAVHNAAEALGLLPGVNVLNTNSGSFIGGVDSAARAEGMFVSVRGMDAEFNVNLINGVTIAQGMPRSREVQLSLLPPSGLKTVILNKTSRADMDGDAIGGTVDFRTPTAFDYAGDFASITTGARLESRPLDYSENGLGYNFGAEIAHRFGADQQLGIYASGYYTLRHFVNSEMGGVMESGCCDNGWKYKVGTADNTTSSGVSPPGVDPLKNLELTAFNVGVASGMTKQFGGNISIDWQPDDTTSAYTRLTYAYALTQQDSHLSQIVAMGVLTGSDSPFQTPEGYYQPDLTHISIRDWMETNPEVAELGTFQVGLDKKIDSWTISPNLFYSWGRDDRPNHIEISARTHEAQGGDVTEDGFPYGQTSLVTYSNNFPYANLTPEMTAQLYNIRGLLASDRGELQKQYSGQKKGGAKIDVRKSLSDLLELKFGAKFLTSSRHVTDRDWTNPAFIDGTTYGQLPIWNGDYKHVFPGKYGWSVPKLDEDALLAYYGTAADPIKYLDTCGGIYLNSLNCNNQDGTERVSAAYASVDFHTGAWEVTPGVRFEHTDIHNTYWVIPSEFSDPNDPTAGTSQVEGHFDSNHTVYNEALPSIFVNYRPDPLTVYRAGIWTSYTRPAFVKLGGGMTTTPSASGATTLTRGNPNLKPVKATNYDLSGEWDNGAGRHILLGGYFKTIKDYTYDTVANQEDPTAASPGLIIKQPINAGNGQVWGLEFGARQKFTFLPEPFDGFGISGNLTREHTLVHLHVTGFDSSSPIQNAPDWLANVELFYEKHGLSVGLLYNYSGKYLAEYDKLSQNANWDDLWVRPIKRLDMHAGYAFESGLKLDLSVSNLLRDYTYWSHIGKDSLAISDIVDSGMTGFFNVTYKF
ncbi:MAG: TonB-dependent receptor [Steroidobacteraceae bacterium]